ncbi:MAG: DUF971 domain-containing protein [Melioribacteraceae bacterium]|nr:DUF971 domain-containing protein [Melioribacteraceae bacterium]MCF8353549.1 DUF971 domain-containing protein [Melioribacteraceae bacterium]MCF8392517.1 DUF971 domain-containing protein [Melioribacteraceae bacterium]MCF8418468.1 DUF971 domain-containing protein [Melioribacteraceae bacterium]
MIPKQIKINDGRLNITWSSGDNTSVGLKYLRKECPCANCKGETILLKTIRPVRKSSETPEMYKIADNKTIGGYAVKITWRDGHDTGIYSWEYLKTLADDESQNLSHDYKPLL